MRIFICGILLLICNFVHGQTLRGDDKQHLATDTTLMPGVVVIGIKVKTAAATRTLQKVEDIPQSIAIIGQRVIKQQAVFDLPTITRNMSGINYSGSYSGAGSSQFFNARGFDLNDAQNYRLNGMMIWNWGSNYADNIEQVEFLKGPASILYGDLAPGGILNFATKKPLDQFMANVNVKTGSWGLIRPSVDITGPLNNSRSLRYRLNTSLEKSNSFRDKVSLQKLFLAPTLAWDITPKLSIDLEAIFKNSKATDDAGLVSPNGSISGLQELSPSLYLGEPERKYLYRDKSYYSTLTYKFNENWQLKLTGFLAHSNNRPFGIWFDQPDSLGNFARRSYGFYQQANNGTASFEGYGAFRTGKIKHRVLIGVEHQRTNSRYTNSGILSLLDTANINAPVYGRNPTIEPPSSPYQPYVSIISRKGFYLQDQLALQNDKLQLLLGFRLGDTRQGNHYIESETPGTDYEGYTDDLISKTIFTPRIGLVYKPGSATSLYISYSKGYELNSADIFAKNYFEYTTPPATISTQVEFGTKFNLLNRLGLTLSMFEINKHNPYGYVYLDPENPNYDEYDVYYDGHHRSRGIELDADGRIGPSLSVTAGAAYTQTTVIDDPGYANGSVLPNAPKYTANIWLNYEPVKWRGFTLGTGFFYKDKFYSSLANDPKLLIPASYTWDAAVGYTYKKIGVQLNVMNLTNQVSYLNPWQFNLFDVRPLRQFIVTLNYNIKAKK